MTTVAGYFHRDMIISFWSRRYALIKLMPDDIAQLIQLYSYPIPFGRLTPLLSYEILTKHSKNQNEYEFQRIEDMYSYKRSDPDNCNDVIYHPLQPIIPDTLSAKSISFSNTHSSAVSITKLRLVLEGFFFRNPENLIQYKYNGKVDKEIPEIWKCKNGKQKIEAIIISFDVENNSIEYEWKGKKANYALDAPLISLLQKELDNGALFEDLRLCGYSAPLRLPKEKYLCVVSAVDDIINVNNISLW